MSGPGSKKGTGRGPCVAVLAGGISREREVSLSSGRAVAGALAQAGREHRLVVVDAAALPGGLDPEREVVFPALHGTFGEDGGVQDLLERAGFAYVGSDAAASRLCFDKVETKAVAARVGVPVVDGVDGDVAGLPPAAEIVRRLGPEVVLKPVREGSSVGLKMVSGEAALARALAGLGDGRWMAERRLAGRELTVGLLGGVALGVVEVLPGGGVYDYAHKYTSGLTAYRAPADVEPGVAAAVRGGAEAVFAACGCRDTARVDFILPGGGEPHLLEVNTLPGLTPTSLLPKSAACHGLDFGALVEALLAPALGRFARRARAATGLANG